MLQISIDDVKRRLATDNPWWTVGRSIDGDIAAFPRRTYLAGFLGLIGDRSVRRAVVLMGPRRVGKTIMILHAIQALIDGGVPGRSIFYVSLDTPVYNGIPLEQLLFLYREMLETQNGQAYVFFDEVQYLKNWEVHLKSLVDSYRSITFVASGSAAAALRLKSQESGAGRFTDFMLPPLTFCEYLRFIGREDALVEAEYNEAKEEYDCRARDIDSLNAEFVNYLNFGGYPEAVFSAAIRSNTSRYIRSDIIDKVLLRDLPSLYGIEDIQELNSLFTNMAYNTGNELSIEGLAQNSGVAKNTLRRYIEYLEAAFLIHRLHKIGETGRKFKRVTGFKVYLTNPSLRAALFGPIHAEDEAMGRLAETAILSQWLHSDSRDLFYARWDQGEVDLVHFPPHDQRPFWAMEIKWSDRCHTRPSELAQLLNFARKNNLSSDQLGATTRSTSGVRQIDGYSITFTPCSLYCYAVGRNVTRAHAALPAGNPIRIVSPSP